MEREQWWYFTFGCGQKHAGHYVKFFGRYYEAREKMFATFGKQWAFQYSEEEWNAWAERCRKDGMEWMIETELKSC